MPNSTITEMHPDVKRCLRNCLDCYESCLHTAGHGLELGGRHATAPFQALLQDCAAICQAHAEIMMRNSPRQTLLAAACAEASRQCADACRELGDDRIMAECARVCDRCAESCAQMAGA